MKTFFSNQPLLILAHRCETNPKSEYWHNFKWCEAISSHTPVTLLTLRSDHAEDLVTRLPNAEVVFLSACGASEDELTEARFCKEARFWIVDQAERRKEFCLAHHLTESSCDFPSPLLGLGIPYVVGNPKCSEGAIGNRPVDFKQVKERFLSMKESPLTTRSLFQAEVVMSGNREETTLLESLGLNNIVQIDQQNDIAMPKGVCPSLAKADLKLLNIGDTKVVREAMDQLADLQGIKVRSICQSQRRKQKQVKAALAAYLEDSDLLVVADNQPSSICAIKAALHKGVPVLAVASQETRELIDHSCGFLVTNNDDVSTQVAATIRRVRAQPFLLTPMRSGARKRSRVCNVWREGGAKMIEIYNKLMVDRVELPAAAF